MANSQDEVSSADKILSIETDVEDKQDDSQPCFRAESQKGDRNKIVCLNVGGKHYKISHDALMQYEGTTLASLVSDKRKEGVGEDEIFIDRDGCHFKYILDYIRSDRVYVSNLSELSELKDEFDYFGIDADMSKVSVIDDYMTIDELSKEIKEDEAIIHQKKMKIASIKESYRMAGQFSNAVGESGPLQNIRVMEQDVDQDLLRHCLLSRGLYVVSFEREYVPYEPQSGLFASICPNAVKEKYAPKPKKSKSALYFGAFCLFSLVIYIGFARRRSRENGWDVEPMVSHAPELVDRVCEC